jgi:hypothetical protein
MSAIRVDKLQSPSGTITLAGITTFSGGAFSVPGGEAAQRPSSASVGEIRYLQGDLANVLEYYNGVTWVQL